MQNISVFHSHAYPEQLAAEAIEFLNDYYHVTCEGLGFSGFSHKFSKSTPQ